MPQVTNSRVPPTCLVLLATHNGEDWLPEQLESIFSQTKCTLKCVVSDDHSTDSTRAIVSKWGESHDIELISTATEKFGNANRNFLHLIRSAKVADAAYVALSDQDDIWRSDKLAHAISKIEHTGYVAYSSNVEAFWSNGKKRLIKKSQRQTAYDHYFSSPGPGCTFVFSKSEFLEIQSWVSANHESLKALWVHDWLLYAYVRSKGHGWLIDDWVSLRYRQHSQNQIGANSGIAAFFKRFRRIFSGDYLNDILSICKLLNAPPRLISALERFSFVDRIWLIAHAHMFRRSLFEVFALAGFFLFMKKSKQLNS